MELTAATNQNQDSAFLDWFATRFAVPVHMARVDLGEISYHRAFVAESRAGTFVSTGRGLTPMEAAIKGVSEYIERKVFLELSRKILPSVSGACRFTHGGKLAVFPGSFPSEEVPRSAQTSNGWAVHPCRESAIENALTELIERHCLILSFLRHEWRGFKLVDDISVEGVRFISCVSTVRVGGIGAGVVIGVVPQTGGIGLGYMADLASRLLSTPKWRHAFFESYDNVQTFDAAKSFPFNSIEQISQEYLMNRFENESDLHKSADFENGELHGSYFELFDLKKSLGCPTPLFAAHVVNPELVPLFFPRMLGSEGTRWLKKRLRPYGDFNIPERMPLI